MTDLAQFDVVRLVTDRYRDRGVGIDALGTILEVYEEAFEVEFSRLDGMTIDWFPVESAEVEFVARLNAPASVGPASPD